MDLYEKEWEYIESEETEKECLEMERKMSLRAIVGFSL